MKRYFDNYPRYLFICGVSAYAYKIICSTYSYTLFTLGLHVREYIFLTTCAWTNTYDIIIYFILCKYSSNRYKIILHFSKVCYCNYKKHHSFTHLFIFSVLLTSTFFFNIYFVYFTMNYPRNNSLLKWFKYFFTQFETKINLFSKFVGIKLNRKLLNKL